MQQSTNRLLSPLNDIQIGTQFDFKIYDQIVKTKNKISDEICRDIHVQKHDEIRSVFFNKRHVSKDSVCLWLGSVYGYRLLEQFCIPTLVKCDEQNRKIATFQKTVIDLQAQVIQKSDLLVNFLLEIISNRRVRNYLLFRVKIFLKGQRLHFSVIQKKNKH